MATYLIDTNILIDAINQKRNRNQFLLDLTEQQGHTLACCPINVAEVYAGMRPKEEQRTAALLRSLQLFPVTFPVAEMAGLIRRDHAKKGVTLSLTDAIIAAVAIHNRLTLITDNIKDFPMPELSLYPLSN
jgi:predicted nucleic acid-binding protein